MIKYRCCLVCVLLLPVVAEAAGEKHVESEPKVISGMSIVGNDETPKSLYIVPWKDEDAGKEINFTSRILNDELSPVDKNEFIRKLHFIRNGNQK